MSPKQLPSLTLTPIADRPEAPLSNETEQPNLSEQDVWAAASLAELPTMYDLPSEAVGEAGLPDEFRLRQAQLLERTFVPEAYPIDDVFSAIDLNLYYDSRNTSWYKRPDWFTAVGVSRLLKDDEMRLSYLVWREGVAPFLVVELLSPDTAKEDLGKSLRDASKPPAKWEVYEQILRVPYYVVYGRLEAQPLLFRLSGSRYEPVELDNDRYWIPEISLGIGLWQGSYHGADRAWLRWYGSDGHWIPTAEEQVETQYQRADQEYQRADQERQRADRLAQMLRDLGVDPGE
jgi:Uma2 family endonuclease